MKGSPEYISWQAMKSRCLNRNDPFFHRYGERGITIYLPWIASFELFFEYIGPRPEGTTLERKRSSGNYEPGNVCWATHRVQQRNRSSNRILTHAGESLPMVVWAERIGLNYKTLKTRINKLKWPIERALTQPLRGK
jgi:hypothetical protein